MLLGGWAGRPGYLVGSLMTGRYKASRDKHRATDKEERERVGERESELLGLVV